MKKTLAILGLVAVMAVSAFGCGKKECDYCGDTTSCKTDKIDGEKINYCEDCEGLHEAAVALYDMFS